MGEPPAGGGGVRAVERVQQRRLVVAEQGDGLVHRAVGAQRRLDGAGGVGPPVDQVAELHQQALGRGASREVRRDQGVQRAQAVGVAVHVADGVDAPPRRQVAGTARPAGAAQARWRCRVRLR